jgi:modification methylase
VPKTLRGKERSGGVVAAAGDLQPTTHLVVTGDARKMDTIVSESTHLIVTSPPYWILKDYNAHPDQLGAVSEYQEFLDQLDHVWRECFDKLVAGGRLCINVGDVCLPRRKAGRHHVIPLHADITVRCREIGFDSLAPILWYKVANMKTEVSRGGGSWFLGKPFEPNGIIKNDIEYVLLLRKPGGYRKPTEAQREGSRIRRDDYFRWYRQIWDDIGGTSLRGHPAPFPLEFASRLVRMFSFVDDTVVDPFLGSGTTSLAAAIAGRNSIGYEVDPEYAMLAVNRLRRELEGRGPRIGVSPEAGLRPDP